ncbi:MAG TPA: FAD-dependent oxidoreductase [Thermomicrobiaceae bacterium]|nr:FAD-dependent oxidoreductase [Thermomicrobiaceae bacterium]
MSGVDATVPRSAEIVIVGAGVVGLSIAFHLAERGATGVVVLERDTVAAGSTSKATGGIRHQFGDETAVRLSLESIPFFADFERRTGAPFLFRRHGYLFLVPEARLDALRHDVALQRRLGVPTELLAPEEVRARWPAIDVDGIAGAGFCALDGSGSPTDAAHGFLRAARDRGVQVLEGVAVTGIAVTDGRVVEVETDRGRIAAGTVVNAAGPWAPLVAGMVEVELPIVVQPRQVFVVSDVAGLPEGFPFTIDMGTGVYVHREAGSVLLGGGDRDRAPGYDATLDWSRFEGVAAAAVRRVPLLAEARSLSGWCGLRAMTPDEQPILGPVGPAGSWCAAGFSGHGFMHAPAVGRLMAEWLLDGAPRGIDPASLTLDRFGARAEQAPDADRIVF